MKSLFCAILMLFCLTLWAGEPVLVYKEDFSQGISPRKWEKINRQWGGDNRGVIAENILWQQNGDYHLILKAQGDKYQGLSPASLESSTRVGAALASIEKYGPGKFEICMRLPKELGLVSAFWLYDYQDNPIRNNEIDWELPADKNSDGNISYDYAHINTWGGQFIGVDTYFTTEAYLPPFNQGQSAADGKFHKFGLIWQTPKQDAPGFVQWTFASDCDQEAQIVHTYTGDRVKPDHVPRMPMQLWVGLWFPANGYKDFVGWAGNPDFAQTQLEVKWLAVYQFKQP